MESKRAYYDVDSQSWCEAKSHLWRCKHGFYTMPSRFQAQRRPSQAVYMLLNVSSQHQAMVMEPTAVPIARKLQQAMTTPCQGPHLLTKPTDSFQRNLWNFCFGTQLATCTVAAGYEPAMHPGKDGVLPLARKFGKCSKYQKLHIFHFQNNCVFDYFFLPFFTFC